MKVVVIGAGNLAAQLAPEMQKKGLDIVQVYSRTARNAEMLARRLGCRWTVMPEEIDASGDLYVFSLKDTALPEILPRIAPNDGLWVHTAGSLPMAVFAGYAARYGVLYPLQTFSKERAVDFRTIPFFIEAASEADLEVLRGLASLLTTQVEALGSEQRRFLHLAAVFACNFTNHMYALAAGILEEQGLPFDRLLPLIDETAAKVHAMAPRAAQTGPAVRYDRNVLGKHLEMLDSGYGKALYEMISKSIHQESVRYE